MSALIVTAVLGVLLLFLGLYGGKRLLAPVGLAGLMAVLFLTAKDWNYSVSYFHDMVVFDNFSLAFNAGMIVITAMIFLFGIDYYARMEENVAEHYALMVFSLCGAFLMTSYSNLIMLFLGIEILSIPLYILAGGKKRSYRSSEASFKYFLLGSFATAFFLFGIALIYGVTGSFYLPEIQAYVTAMPEKPDLLFITGLFFILVGLGFKVAAVPFHFWSPDVYEGSPTLITAFMSTVVKTAAFAALYRLIDIDIVLPEALVKALWGMTFLTLAVGNLVALRQSSFKRLMAWSSIANSGFLLLLLLAQHRQAESALFYYLFTYSISTLGLFVIFILVKRAANGDERMQAFRGLFRAKPWVAIVTMILMLSLAGIPPLAGFMAKYQVLMMAIDMGFLKTALFAVGMTLIGMYYYLLVVREAFTPMEEPVRPVISLPNAALILACGVLTLFFGFVPFYLL